MNGIAVPRVYIASSSWAWFGSARAKFREELAWSMRLREVEPDLKSYLLVLQAWEIAPTVGIGKVAR